MEYPYTIDVQVRYKDVDAMGHVNNAVYATYLEQARAGYFDEVLGERLDRVDTVLATLTIDFRRPIELGDDVTVELTIPELGRSSLQMEYVIRTNDSIAATAEATQIVVDRESGSSRPIPEEWRERIESFEDR